MMAVCILFKKKPDWDNSRNLLSQADFITQLHNYKHAEIDEAMDKKMRVYIDDPDFKPEKVEGISKAAANICQWVIATVEFARVSKIVEPKKKAAADAQAKLDSLMAELRLKQKQLAEVEAALQNLQKNFEAKKAESAETEKKIQQTERRFQNASKLVSALNDEGVRWAASLETAKSEKTLVLGDSILAAASLAYIGPFTASYRADLIDTWIDYCEEYGYQ